LVRLGWSWLTAIELLLYYIRHVILPLLLGHVVICDRYVCDAFADWSAHFGEEAERRLAARVLRFLTPDPRIAYWLDVPTAVAQSRSTDPVPESFVKAQRATYHRLAAPHDLRRLDGDRAQDAISDEIALQVLDTYFSEYRTLVNSLFLKNPGQWR
jgi:thymidylate kinase